ncbi:MAG: hypothetical protein GEU82_02765 [Luteitalea sp.]|nr:hypothetical protein [Luteitalea sp.]
MVVPCTAMAGSRAHHLRLVAALLAAGVPLLAQTQPSPTVTGSVNPPRSPRNASYTISARLDAPGRTITGSETIAWRNITANAATELQFHLYWNGWRDTRSTFMRERALSNPASPSPDDFSRIDVSTVRIVGAGGATDLTSGRRFIQPDDDNPDDQTMMAVPLPQPVEPGERLTIEISWTAKVPRTFARTGAIGNYFFIAQWFPKLGVLEDRGWNTHQFHAATEFFSDYGVYDVQLTVPSAWLVGATGVQQAVRENGDGTATHRYYQEDVHDFVWTTSPDYIERIKLFDVQGLPPVAMRLLILPEHAPQADRHFAAAETALKWYGQWFGPYFYGHITIVDPAYQSGADGMEYPTLITAGTRWLVGPEVTLETPEEVTAHEAGHQFFYGIVGTNEFEHAWMDEGINTFATARAMQQDFPETFLEQRYFGGFVPWVFNDIRLSRETVWNRLPTYRPAAKSDPGSAASYRYSPVTGRYITYNKTALWLNTMERWLGWETLQRVLAAFYTEFQFKHPTPDDFFNTANRVSGRDLGWFFDQVHRSSNVFDYGVEDLKSASDGAGYRTTVLVRRYGEAIFPVAVRVRFEDGTEITEQWDGRDRWTLFTYQRPARALSAHVDPDRVLLLDVNYTNNSRTLQPQSGAAATKWALKWMVWLQDSLLTWAFFA